MNWIGFILTCISVCLCAKKNIWTWPFGLTADIVWGIHSVFVHDYALLACNAFLFVFGIYGWISWAKAKNE